MESLRSDVHLGFCSHQVLSIFAKCARSVQKVLCPYSSCFIDSNQLVSGNSAFEFVLTSIVNRSLELTSGLLRRHSPTYTYDKDAILKICVNDYNVFRQRVVPEIVNITIAKDVLIRQRALDITATYRRYVVLDCAQTFRGPARHKEELRNEVRSTWIKILIETNTPH